MKPRTVIILALLLLIAVGAFLLHGDRPLALLARWRKATAMNKVRHTLEDIDADIFGIQADDRR